MVMTNDRTLDLMNGGLTACCAQWDTKETTRKETLDRNGLVFNLSFEREVSGSVCTRAAGEVVSRFLDSFPFYHLPALSNSTL